MIQGIFRLPYSFQEILDNNCQIEDHPIFDGRFLSLIQSFESGKLSTEEIKFITEAFHSKDFSFDEVDRLKLWIAYQLNDPSKLFKAYPDFADHLTLDKNSLARFKIIKSRFMDEVSSRISLLSTLTLFCPDQLIPSLIEICPKYLACPTINNWVIHHSYNATWVKETTGDDSRAIMIKLQKSLVKDKRMIEKLPTENFILSMDYEILSRNISLFRELHRNENRTPQKIEDFCNKNNIPREYAQLIHSSGQGPKDLALDIFVKLKRVTSERAFRDVLTKGNSLVSKHGALSFMPEMIFFFKLNPGPPELHNPNLWRVFESSVSIS